MSDQDLTKTTVLVKLSESGLILENHNQDIRGREVFDKHGEKIGRITDLFIDADERKIRMIAIRSGGFLGMGDRHFLVPIHAIAEITNKEVHLNQTHERLLGSPVYDPSLQDEPTEESVEPFYGYYGLSPYGSHGYLYPEFPMSPEETVLYDHGAHIRPV